MGAEIEVRHPNIKSTWTSIDSPSWISNWDYRIKPEPKPDVIVIEHYALGYNGNSCYCLRDRSNGTQVQFTFDGETGKLKAVELL